MILWVNILVLRDLDSVMLKNDAGCKLVYFNLVKQKDESTGKSVAMPMCFLTN